MTDVKDGLTEREIALAAGEDPDKVVEGGTSEEGGSSEALPSASGEPAPGGGADEQPQPEEDGATEGAPGGTEAARSPSSWITDELRKQAEDSGLNPEYLDRFSGPDDAEQAIRLAAEALDREFSRLGQGDKEAPPKEASAPPKEEAAPAEAPSRIDRQKFADAGYDEDTLSIVDAHNAMVDRFSDLQKSLSQVETLAREERDARRIEAFHDIVDTMDKDRFGKSLDDSGGPTVLDRAHDENRRKLYDAAETLAAGMLARAQAAGTEPALPPLPVLLARAERLAFGDEIAAQERERREQAIRKQATRRRGVGRARPVAAKSAEPGDDDVVNNPDIKKLWDQYQQENGL